MGSELSAPPSLRLEARAALIAKPLIRHNRILVLAVLLAAALGIRLYHINEPPLHYHATRQYRSLLIARSYYFDTQASVPEWKKEIASVSRQRQGMLEPPILAFVVSLGYRLMGGERFWIPQLLSSIFWLTGGCFLYLIGERIAGGAAALVATAFYLFLPFAVVASRSFQPDPLMMMLLLASIFSIIRYYESPSNFWLTIAAASAASAFLVKPVCLFTMLGAFVAPAISSRGFRQAVLSRDSFVFVAIMVSPAVMIYLYGTLTGNFLVGEAEKTLLPQLWFSQFFWRGWLANISATVGAGAFIGALLGVLLFRKGLPIALMIGLWAGYVMFGLVFNYNLATHDYYQLQLIPIVGLSIGPVVTVLMNHLHRRHPQVHWRVAAWAIVLLPLFGSVGIAKSRLDDPEVARKVRSKQEIGERVKHSTRTIFLSEDYGVPLEYHGLLSGSPWPLASDFQWAQFAGVRALDVEERWKARVSQNSSEYFIVEDLGEFERQPELREFLTARFPVVARTNAYLIFKLTDR